MDGIFKVPGGFNNAHPKIEKTMDQPKEKRRDNDNNSKNKKKKKDAGSLFEGLAHSLEHYTEEESFNFYS